MFSNQLGVSKALLLLEAILFVAALVSAYLSEVGEWGWFSGLAVFTTLGFLLIRILDAWPELRRHMVEKDFAAKIAEAAIPYGIVDYFNMQSQPDQTRRNEQTQKDIAWAQNLWLCANSGASYIDPSIYRHWPSIEARLKEGVEFRVVLLDPFSEEKRFRNRLNVIGESSDSKVNIASIVKLSNAYPGLQVRFAKLGMHATVFATNDTLYFDPYHVGLVDDRIENRTFSLRIENSKPESGVGLYRVFKSHFDTLWRSSVSLGEWIEGHKQQLPVDLPDLRLLG